MSEFFREPNREKLREILRGYDGEYDNLDFKQAWIDQAKLAKHVLAFANSGGGVVIFGVSEESDNTLSISGLDELFDKSDLSVSEYLPAEAEDIFSVEEYNYSSAEWNEIEESIFQVLFIEDRPQLLPIISEKGAEGRIERDSIYVRKNTKSEKANQKDIERLIDRRVREQLQSESRDLRNDLSQLNALYDFKNQTMTQLFNSGLKFGRLMSSEKDGFERYVESRIGLKKDQIDDLLGVQ